MVLGACLQRQEAHVNKLFVHLVVNSIRACQEEQYPPEKEPKGVDCGARERMCGPHCLRSKVHRRVFSFIGGHCLAARACWHIV